MSLAIRPLFLGFSCALALAACGEKMKDAGAVADKFVDTYYVESDQASALKLTEGNREEAAKMLGIGERTLYRKIQEYKEAK